MNFNALAYLIFRSWIKNCKHASSTIDCHKFSSGWPFNICSHIWNLRKYVGVFLFVNIPDTNSVVDWRSSQATIHNMMPLTCQSFFYMTCKFGIFLVYVLSDSFGIFKNPKFCSCILRCSAEKLLHKWRKLNISDCSIMSLNQLEIILKSLKLVGRENRNCTWEAPWNCSHITIRSNTKWITW